VKFDLDTLSGNKGGSLKRTFNPGVWGAFSATPSHFILSLTLGRVQADNQLRDYELDSRTVFAPDRMAAVGSGQ